MCLSALTVVPVDAARTARTPNAASPLIYVGHQKIRVPAIVTGGRVLVPVRGVFEAIGADVAYSAPHFVIVRKDGAVIAAFILDRVHAVVGRRAVDLDVPPMRRDGRVYVPLRTVAEAAGATVAYTSRPSIVHIWRAADVASDGRSPDAPTADANSGSDGPQGPSTAKWVTGVAIFTGLCCLGCLVLTARRFAPTLFAPPRARRAVIPAVESQSAAPEVPPADRVALTSVESTGEARFHKAIVTETRTIDVPVTREELVIEYAGEGGTVIIEGRALEPGETVRIPLWEERVKVDVTKHVLLNEDIVIGKRRVSASAAPAANAAPAAGLGAPAAMHLAAELAEPPEPDLAEGSPS